VGGRGAAGGAVVATVATGSGVGGRGAAGGATAAASLPAGKGPRAAGQRRRAGAARGATRAGPGGARTPAPPRGAPARFRPRARATTLPYGILVLLRAQSFGLGV